MNERTPREAVFERLSRCHRRIEERMSDLDRAVAGDTIDRELVEDAIAFANRAIARHEDDEEASLFSRMPGDERARSIIERLVGEHATQRELWKRLRAAAEANAASDDLSTVVRELRESYEHHVRVEENELFPLLEEAIADADWSAIDEEMSARRGDGGGGGGGGGRRR